MREIGERFRHKGVLLEVVEEKENNSCRECVFAGEASAMCNTPWCGWHHREDGSGVILKKVEESRPVKPIFKNKQEAEFFLKDVTYLCDSNLKLTLGIISDKGYIEQTTLAEAKKEYHYHEKDRNIAARLYFAKKYIDELETKI